MSAGRLQVPHAACGHKKKCPPDGVRRADGLFFHPMAVISISMPSMTISGRYSGCVSLKEHACIADDIIETAVVCCNANRFLRACQRRYGLKTGHMSSDRSGSAAIPLTERMKAGISVRSLLRQTGIANLFLNHRF